MYNDECRLFHVIYLLVYLYVVASLVESIHAYVLHGSPGLMVPEKPQSCFSGADRDARLRQMSWDTQPQIATVSVQ